MQLCNDVVSRCSKRYHRTVSDKIVLGTKSQVYSTTLDRVGFTKILLFTCTKVVDVKRVR